MDKLSFCDLEETRILVTVPTQSGPGQVGERNIIERLLKLLTPGHPAEQTSLQNVPGLRMSRQFGGRNVLGRSGIWAGRGFGPGSDGSLTVYATLLLVAQPIYRVNNSTRTCTPKNAVLRYNQKAGKSVHVVPRLGCQSG